MAPCAAVSESTPPMPSASSTPPVSSAFRFCDSLAHPASATPVSCGGGSVLGQSAVDCTASTESPLGSPLAPSIRLGGDLASLAIGPPAEIPPSSGAGDELVAWEWNGGSGGMVRVFVVMVMVVMCDRVVGGTSDIYCMICCAAPVPFCSRWVGSTGPATSSSGGSFGQLVGTRMYRERAHTSRTVAGPSRATTRELCSPIPSWWLGNWPSGRAPSDAPALVLPLAA